MLTRFGLNRSTLLTFASTLLTVGFLALPAGGQAVQVVTLSTVADTTLLVPDSTTSTFTQFPPNPCISYGNDAFFGVGSGGEQGIYASLGGTLTTVADLNTGVPGGTGNFTAFSPSPFLSGNNIAFYGGNASQQGIYRCLPPNPCTPVVDTNTAIPGGSGSFTGFGGGVGFGQAPVISGNNVAFYGEGTNQQGIYSCLPPNPCAPVADLSTTFPGTTDKFSAFFQAPAISGSNVAFSGFGSSTTTLESGVYACLPPNPCTPVADSTTAVPGGSGVEFLVFPSVSLAGTNVAFVGISTDTSNPGKNVYPAVYVGSPGVPPVLVADLSTAVPGGSGSFSNFGVVAIDPNNVAFEGYSSANSVKGVYGRIGGSLIKIVADGDTLAGKTVSNVNLGPGGFSGDQILFTADFTDGTHAIAAGILNGGNRCPLSQGFWKNHPAQWPETTLTLGSQNYSQSELLAILNTTVRDASVQLAQQLIPAKLSIFNGSNPAPAAAAIADADGALDGFTGKLPYGVKPSSPVGQRMVNDANVLINYNSDLLTPGCTP